MEEHSEQTERYHDVFSWSHAVGSQGISRCHFQLHGNQMTLKEFADALGVKIRFAKVKCIGGDVTGIGLEGVHHVDSHHPVMETGHDMRSAAEALARTIRGRKVIRWSDKSEWPVPSTLD